MLVRIVDETTLARFRGPGACEFCRKWQPRLEASHTFARGMGGGSRLDIPLNLTSLCRQCHDQHHAGKAPTQGRLLEIAATREGVTPEFALAEIYRLLRATKECKMPDQKIKCMDCEKEAEGDLGQMMEAGWQQIQSSSCFGWVCPDCAADLPRW